MYLDPAKQLKRFVSEKMGWDEYTLHAIDNLEFEAAGHFGIVADCQVLGAKLVVPFESRDCVKRQP